MDNLIQISKINDFIFCPYSLYLHSIYECFAPKTYHTQSQTIGKISHQNIDTQKYSTSKRFLQGMPLYSQKYKLVGKLDIYDVENKYLIERKYKIKKIYKGYKFQLYAQMLCLREKGYLVKKMFIRSLVDNKRYPVSIPNRNDLDEFRQVLNQMRDFTPQIQTTNISVNKCRHCIYKVLCELSKC